MGDEDVTGGGFSMDNMQTMGIVNALRTGDARVDMVRGRACLKLVEVVSRVSSLRCDGVLQTSDSHAWHRASTDHCYDDSPGDPILI